MTKEDREYLEKEIKRLKNLYEDIICRGDAEQFRHTLETIGLQVGEYERKLRENEDYPKIINQ